MRKQLMLMIGVVATAAVAVFVAPLWPTIQGDADKGEPPKVNEQRPESGQLPDQPAASALTLNASPDPAPDDGERLFATLDRIEQRLTALTRNQERMQRELDRLSQRPFEETDIQDDPDTESPDAAAAAGAAYANRMEEGLEQQLIHEKVDERWADEMIQAVHEGFRKEVLAGIHPVDATCGSTICQVDLLIDGDLSVEESLQRLMYHRPWTGSTFFSAGADGVARIYFAREGLELPTPPESEYSF